MCIDENVLHRTRLEQTDFEIFSSIGKQLRMSGIERGKSFEYELYERVCKEVPGLQSRWKSRDCHRRFHLLWTLFRSQAALDPWKYVALIVHDVHA